MIETWTVYQEEAMRTCGKLDRTGKLLNAALGLSGETGELLELLGGHHLDAPVREVIKEAGDVLWYVALFCDALDLPMGDLVGNDQIDYNTLLIAPRYSAAEAGQEAVLYASKLADVVKKHVFHDHRLDPLKVEYPLKQAVIHAGLVCNTFSSSLHTAANRNILKLMERYPDGFSSEASINRKA